MEGKICLKLEGADVALKKLEELDAHVKAIRQLIYDLDEFRFIDAKPSGNNAAKATTEEKE